MGDAERCDVVVVGAGFAGMYMLHRARGLGLTVRVFEAGGDVGGTWYWNRYPGARCDVESMEYSYQFDEDLQQEWSWSERYSAQPEILRYASHVANRFHLRDHIRFDTRVNSAVYDGQTRRWSVHTDRGDQVSAQWLVMATGCLSSTNTPDFPGIADFAGPTYHTGKWPHEGVDFTGKRVGIIGTGSSAIQSIPIIAAQAADLTVFQRTANYSIPAHNAPLDRDYEEQVKRRYREFREENSRMQGAFGVNFPRTDQPALEADPGEREKVYDRSYAEGGLGFLGAYADLLLNRDANETAAEYTRDRIHEIVVDQEVADLLSPKQVIGCKRLCLDTGYFETFNLPHVHLVDVSSEPIERLTPTGLRTGGRDYEFDCIIFATGFDAMTGTLLIIDIRGKDGVRLGERWSAGPRTYLGLQIAGFPNMFTISGPGSPSVLTNMIVSIEQHVEFIHDVIEHVTAQGATTIETTEEQEDAWVAYVNAIADMTLFPTCNSWYLGANVPGKTRVFMPLIGFPGYVEKCDQVVANGYEGFVVS